MIISLKNYKEHGYLKGTFLIIRKMFLSLNHASAKQNFRSLEDVLPYSQYPKLSELAENQCTSCGLCEEICPTRAIGLESKNKNSNFYEGPKPKSFWLSLDKCIKCKLCVDVCPNGSLLLEGNYLQKDFDNGAIDLILNS